MRSEAGVAVEFYCQPRQAANCELERLYRVERLVAGSSLILSPVLHPARFTSQNLCSHSHEIHAR